MTHHREHLQSHLREAVQALLTRGLGDPRLDGTMLTITGVDLSADLRNATVRVSVIPAKAQARAIAAVKHAAAHIRRHVADALGLHTPPLLAFGLDSAGKKQAAALEAIAKAVREREGREPSGADGGSALAPGANMVNPSDDSGGPPR